MGFLNRLLGRKPKAEQQEKQNSHEGLVEVTVDQFVDAGPQSYMEQVTKWVTPAEAEKIHRKQEVEKMNQEARAAKEEAERVVYRQTQALAKKQQRNQQVANCKAFISKAEAENRTSSGGKRYTRKTKRSKCKTRRSKNQRKN